MEVEKPDTAEDLRHFCSREDAMAAIPDIDLEFKSPGQHHVAVNLSTGHRIACADMYMASGYVAGSSVLFPQWKYVHEFGGAQYEVSPHPDFKNRVSAETWKTYEEACANRKAQSDLTSDGATTETFTVEGIDAHGRWTLIGVQEEGKELNPCHSKQAALDLIDWISGVGKESLGSQWRQFRIVKTTREILEKVSK